MIYRITVEYYVSLLTNCQRFHFLVFKHFKYQNDKFSLLCDSIIKVKKICLLLLSMLSIIALKSIFRNWTRLIQYCTKIIQYSRRLQFYYYVDKHLESYNLLLQCNYTIILLMTCIKMLIIVPCA